MTELDATISEMLRDAYVARQGAEIARESGDRFAADELLAKARWIMEAAETMDKAHLSEAWKLP